MASEFASSENTSRSKQVSHTVPSFTPRTFGADYTPAGVQYRTWSPETPFFEIEITPAGGKSVRTLRTNRDSDGFHSATDRDGVPGDSYTYRKPDGVRFPDPAARALIHSVSGPSQVVDPARFCWTDDEWRRPSFRDLAIYELHIGTFTQAGTFEAAIEKLPYLRDLGINAIEIMPVADFPGGRNWGYDGVAIYAPARAYGTPDDFRRLVAASHAHGIAVILDVVYNHLGPDGNYLPTLSKHFFNEKHHTPWGKAFNFDAPFSRPVRRFFIENVIYWMEEFHIDGFRLDATHEIPDDSPVHILTEITDAIHARSGYAIAEDGRNEAACLESAASGGHGFDGVWADDFHHIVHVALTREREGYYNDFEGSRDELIDVLNHGWHYRGRLSPFANHPRGTACEHLPPSAFIHCISNHDQTGNRAFGERVGALIAPEAYRTISLLLCLTPYTPMLFMGQEWMASTPFQFFTDHNKELGPLVTEGRRREFAAFKAFQDGLSLSKVPDPQAPSTFLNSKLQWEEPSDPAHSHCLELYRECLKARAEFRAFRPRARKHWHAAALSFGPGAIRYEDAGGDFLLVFDLAGDHAGDIRAEPFCALADGNRWHLRVSTEEERFGGSGKPLFDPATGRITFERPGASLLRASQLSELH